MTFISIDVSQYRPAVCHATLSEGLWRTADDYAEKREGECPTGLWSALLPEYPNAKLQLSTDNPHSRRGLALPWPPEAQVPVGHKDNWNNGCGRVPLLCSLAAIRQEALGNEWKSIRPKVSWQPHGSEQSYEHAALLALACRREEVTRQCLIVPENFNESAQQALLVMLPDTCRLVPRSMALAVKWCQEHQADYQVQASPSRGLLVCVAMGMDEWELSVVEVCSERENGVLRLVPVHDPTIRGRGLGVCGLSLFPYVLNGKPEERIWRNLQRQGQDMMELLAAPELAQRLQTLRSVIASGLRVPFERLPMMRALAGSQRSGRGLADRVLEAYQAQRSSLQSAPVLGIVVGGSFADVPLTAEGRRLAEFLLQPLATRLATQLEVLGASAFAEGGAIVAGCMEKGMLSYKVALMPLDLYTTRKNAQGDKEEHWAELVKQGRTIRAEEDYREPAAIHGLVFPDGKQVLELTLRRRGYAQAGTWLYRKVDVWSGERMTRNEPVVVHCKVRPGQGFAQVEVQSEVKGVFSATVNWERMIECKKPTLELSYIPHVACIVRNDALWNNVRWWINKYYMSFSLENEITEVQWKELRQLLNKLYRDKNSTNIYCYSGPLTNDGILEDPTTPRELRTLVKMLREAWQWELRTNMIDMLLRVGGWLYLYIPDSMAEFVQRQLEQGETKSVYLHVAGLTFHTDSQLKCFYDSFCRKDQHTREWFRSLRNIVRFRDTALSRKVLSDEQAKKILNIIANNLQGWKPECGRKQFYDNCIQVFVYLLKRRRYDEDFLRPDDPQTKQIEQALQLISKNYPTKQYRDYAQASLKFLSGTATHDTVKAVLEASAPADGDDD